MSSNSHIASAPPTNFGDQNLEQTLRLEIQDNFNQLDKSQWDCLVGDMPLLSHAFLSALETSGSVGKGTGWQPYPMLVYVGKQLVGAMPLYLKTHSYGEYRMLCFMI